eukprot:TRINITY_DN2340_c0_g2_i1.p1 TRINITY_DN2340_c0_g2~~TRINITY_DN2340_c0_g2_i1.p1  ORF type:complete len:366 (-),score=120.90 TRINITY_DN2340_c0_g2_i1:55-1152(-)
MRMFEPHPEMEYVKPLPETTYNKMKKPYSGLADTLKFLKEDAELQEQLKKERPPRVDEKALKAQKKQEKLQKHKEKIEELRKQYTPYADSDPQTAYTTLFVGRLNYKTSPETLKSEFVEFGPVRKVRIVTDKETDKPKGYAFIEYETEESLKEAYKRADGRKIDGKRVVVDVERGRTVEGWYPMRLGGGLGGTRAPGKKNILYAGRREIKVEPRRDDRDRYDDRRGGYDRRGGGYDRRGGGYDRRGGGGGRRDDRGGYDRRDRDHRSRDYDRRDRDYDRRDRDRDRYGDRRSSSSSYSRGDRDSHRGGSSSSSSGGYRVITTQFVPQSGSGGNHSNNGGGGGYNNNGKREREDFGGNNRRFNNYY